MDSELSQRQLEASGKKSLNTT